MQDIRLSVRPSVTLRYCVETAKHIIKLFLLSGSRTVIILVLFTLNVIAIFRVPTGTHY